MKFLRVTTVMCLIGLAAPATAQGITDLDTIRQVTTHIGEMSSTFGTGGDHDDEKIVFEPFQMADEMFARDDLVFLMRHGETDWSKRDAYDVAPDDCANQRVLTDEGLARMEQLARILAQNNVVPGKIVASEWCRNQETLRGMVGGFASVDPRNVIGLPIETDAEANLLLSLQGAADVQSLEARIANWDGNPDRPGPLLIITHYTNIEELTQFRIFEGEALVIDPKRDNRVLGYFRLDSAGPDEGHFAETLASPLLDGNETFQMVERFYSAIGARDLDTLGEVLADGWVARGVSDANADVGVEGFLGQVGEVVAGLSERTFSVQDIYMDDDIVTVIGEVTGKHTGEIYGIPASGRDVTFGAIAVHRVNGNQILETWQIADRVSLIQQITQASE